MKTHPPSAPVERRYVSAADVAKACGLSLMQLDNQLRPDDWASPRDFVYDGRFGLRYEVMSLYRLADHLQALGRADAALSLRAFVARLPEPEARPEEFARVPVEHVAAAPAELDRLAAARTRQHASDREVSPFAMEEQDE